MATQSFKPASIDDRATWTRIAADPRAAKQIAIQLDKLDAIPETMPLPTAADFLAAKRSNNRSLVDQHWRKTRPSVARLALNRLLKGIDPNDPDDRLLNWLFAFTFEPTWTVSAHLPNQDLPISGGAQLDLAGCEAAGELAEARETLLPWIETNSKSLGDSIVREIDRRVLKPFLTDAAQWWAKLDAKRDDAHRINNWTGVCAGSILIACQALESTGLPRPEARDKAMALLRTFFESAFGENGECEEGIGYWLYGVEFAALGMMRLSDETLRSGFDIDRVKLVAGYPERCHIAGRVFFAGNDSDAWASCSPIIGSWLADIAGSSFLKWWAGLAVEGEVTAVRSVPHLLRALQAPPAAAPSTRADAPSHEPNRFLADQQAVIFQRPSQRGLFTFTITGGTNAELHNHNDLGTFQLFLDERTIIPDLGTPRYVTDFFKAARYTKYMVAASSGHCCPAINGIEQREGIEAAGKLLAWRPDTGELALDLTTAYPPNAGLKRWTRESHVPNDDALAMMTDTFELSADGDVAHRIWFVDEPRVSGGGSTVAIGTDVLIRIEPQPAEAEVKEFKAGDDRLMLRGYPKDKTLYRLDLTYRLKAGEPLAIQTRIALQP